jgi:hypothetical protein
LSFIFTKDAGSSAPGEPYIARFPDKFGNVKTRKVPRPAVISKYFNVSDVVDSHNQCRQLCLRLEKCWVTHDPWFRLDTTIIGMTVVDCWRLLKFQSKNKAMRSLRMIDFADRLAWDLVHNRMNAELGTTLVESSSTSESSSKPSSTSESSSKPPAIVLVSPTRTEASPVSRMSSDSRSIFLNFYTDEAQRHKLVMTEDLDDSGRPRRRRCIIGNCRADKKQTAKTQYFCDHPNCRAFVYTYGKKAYQGKYFCTSCFDEHRSEILKTLVSSMSSI